jgi:hypothetical protein
MGDEVLLRLAREVKKNKLLNQQGKIVVDESGLQLNNRSSE